MTRPIKFRVWDKKEKEYPGDGMIYFFDIIAGRNKRYVIEQFTGLLDKNGVEIYEGDLLRWKVRYGLYGEMVECEGRVVWDRNHSEYVVCGNGISNLGNLTYLEKVEVIGTIHDKEE